MFGIALHNNLEGMFSVFLELLKISQKLIQLTLVLSILINRWSDKSCNYLVDEKADLFLRSSIDKLDEA